MKIRIAIALALGLLCAGCATPPELKTLSVAQIGYFDTTAKAVSDESKALILAATIIKDRAAADIDARTQAAQDRTANTIATTIPGLPADQRVAATARLLGSAQGVVTGAADDKAKLLDRLAKIQVATDSLQAAINEMKEVQIALDAYIQSPTAGELVTSTVLGLPGVQALISQAKVTMATVSARAADLLALFGQFTTTGAPTP